MLTELPIPQPGPGELLLRVLACGVCRTDVHVRDGEVRGSRLPIVPGPPDRRHGGARRRQRRPRRPGPGWAFRGSAGRAARAASASATARTCASSARFTGLDIDGGFAEWTVADERFCFELPAGYGDIEVAPLLCAGLIGHRALRMTGDARRLGLYGFGAAAHIVTQVALHQGRRVFAFTRAGDESFAGVRARPRVRVGRRRARARGRSRSMRRSSSPPPASSSRPRCGRWTAAASSCAPGST